MPLLLALRYSLLPQPVTFKHARAPGYHSGRLCPHRSLRYRRRGGGAALRAPLPGARRGDRRRDRLVPGPAEGLSRLQPVLESRHSVGFRAVHAAEEPPVHLLTMPDDPAAAMAAHRGQQVDRAFEAVEGVGLPSQGQLEALVVVVAAVIADSHESTSGVRVAVRAGDERIGPSTHAIVCSRTNPVTMLTANRAMVLD